MTIAFHALSDARRRDIVELLLRDGELPVSALVDALPIAQSGVSRHLRVLKEAGFVSARVEGKQRFYSLRPEPFEELDAWLSRYRVLWEQRLDRFERELQRRLRDQKNPPTGESP